MKTFYVGSLWHSDCDPFLSVLGTSAQIVEERLQEQMDEEFKKCSDVPEDESSEISICSSGAFRELIHNLPNFVCEQHQVEEVEKALESIGYFIC